MVARKKDNPDHLMLVPVWDFLGTRIWKDTNSGKDVSSGNVNLSFLTINAIDGSVIDRNLGY
jgi:hypothetical protein